EPVLLDGVVSDRAGPVVEPPLREVGEREPVERGGVTAEHVGFQGEFGERPVDDRPAGAAFPGGFDDAGESAALAGYRMAAGVDADAPAVRVAFPLLHGAPHGRHPTGSSRCVVNWCDPTVTPTGAHGESRRRVQARSFRRLRPRGVRSAISKSAVREGVWVRLPPRAPAPHKGISRPPVTPPPRTVTRS